MVLLACAVGGGEGEGVARVGPLAAIAYVQDLLELQVGHLGVRVAGVQDHQQQAVYDVAVWLPVKDCNDASFLAVQIVEGGLFERIHTPIWVAL